MLCLIASPSLSLLILSTTSIIEQKSISIHVFLYVFYTKLCKHGYEQTINKGSSFTHLEKYLNLKESADNSPN